MLRVSPRDKKMRLFLTYVCDTFLSTFFSDVMGSSCAADPCPMFLSSLFTVSFSCNNIYVFIWQYKVYPRAFKPCKMGLLKVFVINRAWHFYFLCVFVLLNSSSFGFTKSKKMK